MSQWLKAIKLSLNVKKTELIIFCRKAAKIDYGSKLKLDGKRLTPVNAVKYLLDEHLQWSKQLSDIQVKLNRGIEVLRKLSHNENLKTIKIVYHSLCASYLQYGAQLWGQANKESQQNTGHSDSSTQENQF